MTDDRPAIEPVPVVIISPDRRVWVAVRQALIIVLIAVEEYLTIPAAKSALIARRIKS